MILFGGTARYWVRKRIIFVFEFILRCNPIIAVISGSLIFISSECPRIMLILITSYVGIWFLLIDSLIIQSRIYYRNNWLVNVLTFLGWFYSFSHLTCCLRDSTVPASHKIIFLFFIHSHNLGIRRFIRALTVNSPALSSCVIAGNHISEINPSQVYSVVIESCCSPSIHSSCILNGRLCRLCVCKHWRCCYWYSPHPKNCILGWAAFIKGILKLSIIVQWYSWWLIKYTNLLLLIILSLRTRRDNSVDRVSRINS